MGSCTSSRDQPSQHNAVCVNSPLLNHWVYLAPEPPPHGACKPGHSAYRTHLPSGAAALFLQRAPLREDAAKSLPFALPDLSFASSLLYRTRVGTHCAARCAPVLRLLSGFGRPARRPPDMPPAPCTRASAHCLPCLDPLTLFLHTGGNVITSGLCARRKGPFL